MQKAIMDRITTYYGELQSTLWGQRVKIVCVLHDPEGTGDPVTCRTDEELEALGGVSPYDLAVVVPVNEIEGRVLMSHHTVRIPELACFADLARELYPSWAFWRDLAGLKRDLGRRNPSGKVLLLQQSDRQLDAVERGLQPEFEALPVRTVERALLIAEIQPIDALIVEYAVPNDHATLDILARFKAEQPAVRRIAIARALPNEIPVETELIQGLIY